MTFEKKHNLSEFLGSWKGDDIDDLLELVYQTKSKSRLFMRLKSEKSKKITSKNIAKVK